MSLFSAITDRDAALVAAILGGAALLKSSLPTVCCPGGSGAASATGGDGGGGFYGGPNLFVATPDGSTGLASLRQIVAGDLSPLGVAYLAGTQTFTGKKTFPGAGLTAVTIPAIIGGGAGVNGHVVPNVTDDVFLLQAAAQVVSGKTLSGLSNTFSNIPDSALSSNVDLLNTSQTVAAVKTYGTSGTIIHTPVFTNFGSTTLTANNRLVLLNTTAFCTLTLPTAPPNGTTITIVQRGSGLGGPWTVNRGGATDTILGVNTLYISGVCQSVTFTYYSITAEWNIIGATKVLIPFRFISATAGQYMQPDGTGGALATAKYLYPSNYGTTITSSFKLSTRTAATTNNHRVDVQSGNSAGAAALTPSGLWAIVNIGATNGKNSLRNVVTGDPTATGVGNDGNHYVLIATNDIVTPLDGILELEIL